MKITIHAPKDEMDNYIEEVIKDYNNGFTSGFEREGVYWDIEEDEDD